ncbi:MAG TPA: ribosome-associated translation inhibitor RaiA [Paracoccaceae bacterium]|nr:ribosome-associated translation inhibitor RaiA [Paracoccaceae bacterium]
MRIQVNGKHIDVGDALRTHVGDRLGDAVGKYAERPVESNVTFSKDGHEFVCDVSVHLSTGMDAQAKGRANDVYNSFEGAVDRLEKQLRRYKRRLKDHHKDRQDPIETIGASTYVLASAEESEENAATDLQPIIVAEMETKVQTLSVGEAVMQMELSGTNMLVFRNSKHGGVNVIHAREDGNIGWIDPRNLQATAS